MKIIKAIVLPLLGMSLILLFIGIAYVSQSPFFAELLVCGFILSIIFGMRMRDLLQQGISLGYKENKKEALNGSLLRTELKKEQWQY